FSMAGATITLQITLVNPTGATLVSPPPVRASADLTLRWEMWNSIEWLLMGISTPNGPQAPLANAFADTTRALTVTGQVSFTLPAQFAATAVNGVEIFWLLVSISSGNYGQEARYEPRAPNNPGAGYNFFPATFAAPAIRSIRVTYALSQGASPEAVQT